MKMADYFCNSRYDLDNNPKVRIALKTAGFHAINDEFIPNVMDYMIKMMDFMRKKR